MGKYIDKLKAKCGAVYASNTGDGTIETPHDSVADDSEAGKYSDQMLIPDEWTPIFRAYILSYYQEHPDHDRVWLREHHQDVYQQIVTQENRIDALKSVRFFELMSHVKEWRRLMLQAEFRMMDDIRQLFGGDETENLPTQKWPKPEDRCTSCGLHNYDPVTGQCKHCESEEQPIASPCRLRRKPARR